MSMPEIRETEVQRDSEGRVTGYTERVEETRRRRRGGGFGWGLILGAVLVAAGIVAFAYSQGSFQTAGREADQATAEAQSTLSETAENATDAMQQPAGTNETSETATN
jgi:hypothetical protein